MLQTILAFIVLSQGGGVIQVLDVYAEKQINYCHGYKKNEEIWLSCLNFDGTITDITVTDPKNV